MYLPKIPRPVRPWGAHTSDRRHWWWGRSRGSGLPLEVIPAIPAASASALPRCGPRRRKVRSAPFPPNGENCARSLAPPFPIGPAALGSDGGPWSWAVGVVCRCSAPQFQQLLLQLSLDAARGVAKSALLRFRLTAKTAPAPLLRLSPSDPLRWAPTGTPGAGPTELSAAIQLRSSSSFCFSSPSMRPSSASAAFRFAAPSRWMFITSSRVEINC